MNAGQIDLVARADPERVEHEHERVGAVRDADRLGSTPSGSAASRSNPSTSGPKMKRPLSSVRSNAAFSSGIERRVLRLDVNVGNRHARAMVVERRRLISRYAAEDDDRTPRSRYST